MAGTTVIAAAWLSTTRGSPLPGRHNIVLSRRGYSASGATVVPDLDEALSAAGEGDCFVIGGVSPCLEALPRAHRLIATFIDAVVEGDTVFPDLDFASWRKIECVHHAADERHRYAFDIATFLRRS